MNDTEVAQLYHTAWAHWGADSQIDVLIEEMAELTQALIKTRRNGLVFSAAVYEEMADVMICLDQVNHKLRECEKEDIVIDNVDKKLERLKTRLMKSMGKKYPVEVSQVRP